MRPKIRENLTTPGLKLKFTPSNKKVYLQMHLCCIGYYKIKTGPQDRNILHLQHIFS